MDSRVCPPPALPLARDFPCSDGHVISTYEYLPAAEVQASGSTVIFLHGIQSHAGWYSGSCGELASRGHRVLFVNRRGSGIDPVHRGDTPGWRRLILDIQEFLMDDQKLHPGGGLRVLAGISWGGKIAAALASRCPDLLDGVALLCPGLAPKVGLPLLQRLKIGFTRLFRPQQPFPIPLDDPALFTGSQEWRSWLAQDSLSLKQATARFLVESVRLDIWLKWQCRGWKLPTLLLLAGQERIIDNERTKQQVQGLCEGPLTIHHYPEAHHTLEFEGKSVPWVENLDTWLKKLAPA